MEIQIRDLIGSIANELRSDSPEPINFDIDTLWKTSKDNINNSKNFDLPINIETVNLFVLLKTEIL